MDVRLCKSQNFTIFSLIITFYLLYIIFKKFILIITGVIQCFYGMSILIPLLFIVSSFSGFLFCLLLFNEMFVSPDTSTVGFWLVVLLSLCCGGVIGYFAMIMPKYGLYFQFLINIFRHFNY